MGTNHKRRTAFVLLVLLASCVLGCKYRQFKIVMSFDDKGGVVREIDVSLREGEGDDSDLTKDSMVLRLAAIYGEPISADAHSNGRKYRKTFPGKLPQDIEFGGFTNFGALAMEESPLGRSVFYSERMPGPTHWKEILDLFEKLIDSGFRALVAGLEKDEELKGRPDELKRLTEFVRGKFRADFTDAVLEYWLGHVQLKGTNQHALSFEQKQKLEATVELKTNHLLLERGYITSLTEITGFGSRDTLRVVVRRFLREMGPSAVKSPPRLFSEWLEDSASFDKFLSDGFSVIGVSQDGLKESMPSLFPLELGDSASGTVKWRTKVAPDVTNGVWDQTKGELTWEYSAENGPVPTALLWALWNEPDEKFQRRHFGRVLIRKELGRYNQWYLALDPAMKKEWDRFMLALPADNSLARQLNAFEFTSRPRDRKIPAENVVSVSDPYGGVGMILSAMKDPPPASPTTSSQPTDNVP